MKCPECGNSLFNGQFRCEKCGVIVELAIAKKEAAKAATPKKDNKPKNPSPKKETK